MTQFYVYHLIDPRDGKPFYVGKGQRKRGNDHVKDLIVHQKASEHPKDIRIREIVGAGLDVEVKIIERFAFEVDALDFEREQINEIGLENLTNILSGYKSSAAADKKAALAAKPETEKSRMGRPTTFTEELGLEICRRVAAGEAISRLCDTPGMPTDGTIIDWFLKGEAGDERYVTFARNYASAREAQAERFFEQIIEIADTEEVLERARIRIDARKWVAGKLRPKKYGDRTTQVLEGGDKPIETKDTTPSILDSARKIAFALEKARREKNKGES
jgi:hypothetical protein